MYIPFGVAILAATLAIQILFSGARAQVTGAVQYPPPQLGEDVQPPPPAGLVPQVVSPRRIELGVSGSSQPLAGYGRGVHLPAGIDLLPKEPPFRFAPALAPPTAAGD